MINLFITEEAKALEKDYLKEFPNEESPFNWLNQFDEDELIKFVKERNGRKVLVKEDPETDDGGSLIYG